MSRNIVVLLDNTDGRDMVETTCKEKNIIFSAFEDIVNAEVECSGNQRRKNLWDCFDDILDRIKEEV